MEDLNIYNLFMISTHNLNLIPSVNLRNRFKLLPPSCFYSTKVSLHNPSQFEYRYSISIPPYLYPGFVLAPWIIANFYYDVDWGNEGMRDGAVGVNVTGVVMSRGTRMSLSLIRVIRKSIVENRDAV